MKGMKKLTRPINIETGEKLLPPPGLAGPNYSDFRRYCTLLKFCQLYLFSFHCETDSILFDYQDPDYSWALEELESYGWVKSCRDSELKWRNNRRVMRDGKPYRLLVHYVFKEAC